MESEVPGVEKQPPKLKLMVPEVEAETPMDNIRVNAYDGWRFYKKVKFLETPVKLMHGH